jgi:hypothetical protein
MFSRREELLKAQLGVGRSVFLIGSEKPGLVIFR